MYGIFTYIWLIFMVNVANIPYMDGMGWNVSQGFTHRQVCPTALSGGKQVGPHTTPPSWDPHGDRGGYYILLG